MEADDEGDQDMKTILSKYDVEKQLDKMIQLGQLRKNFKNHGVSDRKSGFHRAGPFRFLSVRNLRWSGFSMVWSAVLLRRDPWEGSFLVKIFSNRSSRISKNDTVVYFKFKKGFKVVKIKTTIVTERMNLNWLICSGTNFSRIGKMDQNFGRIK